MDARRKTVRVVRFCFFLTENKRDRGAQPFNPYGFGARRGLPFRQSASPGRNETPDRRCAHPVGPSRGTKRGGTGHNRSTHHRESLCLSAHRRSGGRRSRQTDRTPRPWPGSTSPHPNHARRNPPCGCTSSRRASGSPGTPLPGKHVNRRRLNSGVP